MMISELFSQLNEANFEILEELIESNRMTQPFLRLLYSRNSKNRLKGLGILKLLFEQFLLIYSHSVTSSIQKFTRRDAFLVKLMLECL